MKITKITFGMLRVPLNTPFKTALRTVDTVEDIVVSVHTDSGHVGYGVREEHYATVGAALLWTLEQGLGEGFTPETRDAWAAAYGLLSSAMIEAAAAEVRRAAA